jgi:hypothetical protein
MEPRLVALDNDTNPDGEETGVAAVVDVCDDEAVIVLMA